MSFVHHLGNVLLKAEPFPDTHQILVRQPQRWAEVILPITHIANKAKAFPT